MMPDGSATLQPAVRRYGLGERDASTLAELSKEMSISKERVRQLQREAEMMLRDDQCGPVLSNAA